MGSTRFPQEGPIRAPQKVQQGFLGGPTRVSLEVQQGLFGGVQQALLRGSNKGYSGGPTRVSQGVQQGFLDALKISNTVKLGYNKLHGTDQMCSL